MENAKTVQHSKERYKDNEHVVQTIVMIGKSYWKMAPVRIVTCIQDQ